MVCHTWPDRTENFEAMIALEVTTWTLLGLGILIDLYLAFLVVLHRGSHTPSTVPFLGAIFYVMSGGLRRGLGLSPHWPLIAALIGLHLIWHFGAVTLITRCRERNEVRRQARAQ